MFLRDISDNRLYLFNSKHDLTVDTKYKIILITYFSCAYLQRGGLKELL